MFIASPRATDRAAKRILAGLAAGVAVGAAARGLTTFAPGLEPGLRWIAREVLDPAGQIFLRLLFMVVVPLVFASLAQGVSQLRDLRRLGPMAARTFGLFGLNMAVGVALGLLMMNLLAPGAHLAPETRTELVAAYGGDAHALAEKAAAREPMSLRQTVDLLLPRNLLKSVVDFQLLPLILFALLAGAAATRLSEDHRRRFEYAMQIVTETMTAIVGFAMRLAPWAVAALVAAVVMQAGFAVLRQVLVFVAGVLAVMAIHLFGTMSLLLKLFTRRSPRAFFRAVRTIMVTAFSTSSSNATLPTTLAVTQRELRVSPGTAGFVLPLGATMNMSGTALYEGCVVLFVAQVYGVQIDLAGQIQLLVLAVMSAVAVAGIPGGSLPLLVGLMVTFGLPPEGIALILGFDRLLDMARTVVNVAADVVTAVIVDEREAAALPAARAAGTPPG